MTSVDDAFVVAMSIVLMPVVLLIIVVGLIFWFPYLALMWAVGKVVGRWEQHGPPR